MTALPKQILAVVRLAEMAEARGIERAALKLIELGRPDLAEQVRALQDENVSQKHSRKEAA